MTVFWIIVATFLAGALSMLLPPLWRRQDAPRVTPALNLAVHLDQWREAERDLASGLIAAHDMEAARNDIRRRVIEDSAPAAGAGRASPARGIALVLGVLIPLASVSTYLVLGEPQAVVPPAMPVVAAGSARHALTPEQIQQRVAALAERLQHEPGDAEGWTMLGRSYTALGRYSDAALALRKASQLLPVNPSLLADYADVLAMAQNKRLAGEPARLIQQALDIDPRHVKALALAGSVAFETRDYGAAVGYWQRLVAVLPPGSELANSVQGSIAEAAQLEAGSSAGAAPGPRAAATAPVSAQATVSTSAPAPATSGGPAAAVSGRISLAPELLARVAPGDTLFIFARAAQGPRMPLAIVRQPVGAWPADFMLDDSMAMSPTLRLSAFDSVVIGARISRSGNATPQPGDLMGQSAPVQPGAQGVQVLIGQVRVAGP